MELSQGMMSTAHESFRKENVHESLVVGLSCKLNICFVGCIDLSGVSVEYVFSMSLHM